MVGTFLITHLTDINLAGSSEVVKAAHVIHPNMLPGGFFEVYGYLTGAAGFNAGTLRIRDDGSSSGVTSLSGSVVVEVPLTGTGIFYASCSFMPNSISIVKINGLVSGTGSQNPTIERLAMSWTRL